MDTFLPSHPRSYLQIIRLSLKLYQASFTRIIGLALLVGIIVFAPRFVFVLLGRDYFAEMPPFSLQHFWIYGIDLIALIFFIGIIWRMNCIIRNKHEALIEDLGVALRKFIYIIVADFILTAIMFAITLLAFGLQIVFHQKTAFSPDYALTQLIIFSSIIFVQFVLIAYIFIFFIFLIPLITIEQKNIFSALERSILLVWGNWWRVFMVQITPWFAYLFLLLFIRFGLGFEIHIYYIPPGHETIWTTFLHFLIFSLYLPWIAALLLVQLKDLELRKHLASNLGK